MRSLYVFYCLILYKLETPEECYRNWKGFPKCSERSEGKYVPFVEGQWYEYCDCEGNCSTSRHSCKKAGRKCTSCCQIHNEYCAHHD